jgi:hypothetical protein
MLDSSLNSVEARVNGFEPCIYLPPESLHFLLHNLLDLG